MSTQRTKPPLLFHRIGEVMGNSIAILASVDQSDHYLVSKGPDLHENS